jgi:8-oxo-dGTP pyrophosphatase MutT (NUDIX family)
MRVAEIRDGDIKARAGILITDGAYLLTCKPTPSSKWPNPKLDIPKGHLQKGEAPIDAAIRECYEETDLLFESWKLNRPMQFIMEGEPLYLWEVRLSEMPLINNLRCASTFVDDATGQRHPEMAGYVYLRIHNGELHNLQDRLRPCVDAYYLNKGFVYPFEDRRICADKINLPDGIYAGLRSAYHITLNNGIEFKTIIGVRGMNIPCVVKIKNNFAYEGNR